jgi:hypothetical protein
MEIQTWPGKCVAGAADHMRFSEMAAIDRFGKDLSACFLGPAYPAGMAVLPAVDGADAPRLR